MPLQINTASRTPIYLQLVAQIREAVARGDLQAEEKLPSVRQLSRQLVVNPNTIARAYTELERAGVLNTRPGLGVFVAAPNVELPRALRRERLLEQIDGLLTSAVHLGFMATEVIELVAKRAAQFQWPASENKATSEGRHADGSSKAKPSGPSNHCAKASDKEGSP